MLSFSPAFPTQTTILRHSHPTPNPHAQTPSLSHPPLLTPRPPIPRDTIELQLVSTAPGAPVLQRIASNSLVDLDGVMFDDDTWLPQLVSWEYLKPSWEVLDPELAPDWGLMSNFLPGQVPGLKSMSNDKKTWLLVYSSELGFRV